MMTGTLDEVPRSAATRVAVLTYVLSYDDLRAEASRSFRMTGSRLVLARAPTASAPEISGDRLGLADRWMSGEHAVIEVRGDGHVVRDLGSRNGTWVDGKRITEHKLASGSIIEVGHSLLAYRVADEREVAALDGTPPRLGPTRTYSPALAAQVRDLERIARSGEPILLLAETGAGKEVVAAAIHAWSGRSGAFVTLDCGAVPESLFESTFFGHRRGAYTGATESREGEIVRADGGTLLLDEVANMSVVAQAKLLRVIETGEVVPVGGAERQRVDVRWLAATNRDLFVDRGAFREDLLRRLAGHVARIPPLRARREDLGVLTAHLLADAKVARASITSAAARLLFSAELPGNVRQLRTVLRAAAILAGAEPIDERHLGEGLNSDAGEALEPIADAPPGGVTTGRRTAPTADEITRALTDTGGNVVRAASSLAMHPRQLYRWIERLGVDLERYRT
ncbi:MAG: sigma 54-interacting transcriptional regulator [Myxococcales bacterium]|nr:sigma 54-interacting transcriptional regulator [Myxococcales bacterium]